MLKRRLIYTGLCLMGNLLYALFLTLAYLETLSIHVFLQTLAKFYLMLALNFFAIPLVVIWLPPWWAIYIIGVAWISQIFLYYLIVQADEIEKEL